MTFELLLRGGTCVTPSGVVRADVGIAAGRIAAVGDLAVASAAEVVDATGLHVLPGVIDAHVHLREPGLTHKEDLETGTRAAVLGGVTALLEMPNTDPPTVSAESLADKLARARGRAWCDHAFFVGARPDDVDRLAELERLPGCAGVKIFMGCSTGGMLIADDATLERALAGTRRRVGVHAEDEARLTARRGLVAAGAHVREHPTWRDAECARLAAERILRLARKLGRRVHLLHATTAEEMELAAAYRDVATVEVTPQHLTLVAPDCYEELGTLAQMNPPIRDASHRDALWRAVAQGLVDNLGSDHAPHTREEKARPYPQSPSGMPGVQTLVPIMLDHVRRGRLSLERFVDLTSGGPARVWGIARKGRIALGYDADLTLVDLEARRAIEDAWIASRCAWTPFRGRHVRGWPVVTVVRGRVAMRDGEVVGTPGGAPLLFEEALPRG